MPSSGCYYFEEVLTAYESIDYHKHTEQRVACQDDLDRSYFVSHLCSKSK